MNDTSTKSTILLLVLGFLVSVMTGCTAIRPVGSDLNLSADHTVFSHELFDEVLQTHVNDAGMVNYPALQVNPQELESYYSLIAIYSPDSHPELFPTDNHKLAYWINGYNAGVLKTVLTYYPIESVLDVLTPALFSFLTDKAGFFLFQRLNFGGKTTSLYQLENGVIRKRFQEPRIHFALNCASLGCPRLPRTSFSADLLDQQLDREARRFLAEERNFRINHDAKTIYLSMIFEWFEEDFVNWYRHKFPGRPARLLSYIELYLPAEKADVLNKVSQEYVMRFTPYDWRLNNQQ